MGSIQDLNHHNIGSITKPLGYAILWVQIPYVPSYNEEHVALIVQDDNTFIKKCTVVLGTPMINCAIRAMKESELQQTPEAWQRTYSYEYANYMAQFKNPSDLDERVFLKNKCTILTFESTILHCHTNKTMMMGYWLHVMTQAMYLEDQANLPNGVYVLKTYTKLLDGSHNVSVVLHNLMSKLVHLVAGRCVARVVVANAIPDTNPSPEFLQKLYEMEPSSEPKKLMIPERQKLLLELLKKDSQLDKLNTWTQN